MGNEREIRRLVESNEEDLTLNDVIQALVRASHPLRDLEYGNIIADCKRAKKEIRNAKQLLDTFYHRLRNEVTQDVYEKSAERRSKYKGNKEALEEYRKKGNNK